MMKHYDEYIIQLIQLYIVGDLSGEEKVKLDEWVSQEPSHEKLFKEICDEKNVGIYNQALLVTLACCPIIINGGRCS